MYWSDYDPSNNSSTIFTSGMDGSSPSAIVTNRFNPCALVIDFHSSRLYWPDGPGKKIQSSDLDGRNVATVFDFPSEPVGLAIVNQKLFWGLFPSNILQIGNMHGTDIRIVYNGTESISHLAIPDWKYPRNRTNPCEGHICPEICVLTLISYKCL